MKTKTISAMALLLACLTTGAEQTELEQSERQTEKVMVLGSFSLGVINSTSGQKIAIEARETVSLSNEKKHGLIFGTEETVLGSATGRSFSAYVDFTDIGKLLKAVDYMSISDTNVTKLPNYECRFISKGGLSLFSWYADGKLKSSLWIGGQRRNLDNFKEFKELVEQGQKKLQSIR